MIKFVRNFIHLAGAVAIIAVTAPGAFAQLIPSIGDSLPRVIDETIVDGVERTLERSVEGRVTDTVDRTVEGVFAPTEQILGSIEGSLDPLGRLSVGAADRTVTLDNGWRAVEQEWIAMVAPDQLARLETAGVDVMSQNALQTSDLVLVRVVVSETDDNASTAERLLQEFGASAADRNHVYSPQRRDAVPLDEQSPSANTASPSHAAGDLVIGLIDTEVDREHPTLARARIERRDFVDGGDERPLAHGTAIASLLVGEDSDHPGALRGAQLLAASVFYASDGGLDGATTSSLVAALDWLSAAGVPVVNMSLAGPPNAVLERMIEFVTDRGMIVVAAVGNDGPSARPLYPAAYPDVVGVTAVDRNNRAYRWANRGSYVDFAALGVDAEVAEQRRGYRRESGTSFAAPLIAAAAVAYSARQPILSPADLIAELQRRAVDLGPQGRDDIFGYGLITPAALLAED